MLMDRTKMPPDSSKRMVAISVYHLRSEIVMMMDGWDWILEGGDTIILDLGPNDLFLI